MNIKKTLLIYIFTLGYFISVSAQVYKCTDTDGKIAYSDKKCGVNAELIEIKTKPKQKTARTFFCLSGVSAVVNSLHYPGGISPSEALENAESDLTSMHYRRAIQKVDPSGILPDRVTRVMAEAFPVSEVPGFSSGVVVNVRVCK